MCLVLKKKKKKKTVSDFSTREAAERSYRRHNDSVFTDLFGFFLRSEVACPDCGTKSCNFDPSTSLSLTLPPPPPQELVRIKNGMTLSSSTCRFIFFLKKKQEIGRVSWYQGVSIIFDC